jgi:acyl-coenzyme A synthetase/AMP-(fatty) acid ligase
MRQPDHVPLLAVMRPRESLRGRFMADAGRRVAVRDLADKTSLAEKASVFLGRSVLLATRHQLETVLALAELDGVAARIVICTPDVSDEHLRAAIKDAGIEIVVTDGQRLPSDIAGNLPVAVCGEALHDRTETPARTTETEWVLFTSGTTGRPKLVLHTLKTLMGAFGDGVGMAGAGLVWSTFYDVRRYGGMQILLRALAGGGSIVLSDPAEAPANFLRRAGDAKVTHISGTPSHWRRALMSGAANDMAPASVRLSGEPADQSILDALGRAFPHAEVAHAFASTEAGVAFDVRDGKAGFPASLLADDGVVGLRVEEGSLRIRSARTAARYVGADAPSLTAADGFVDTGDMVERHGDRYVFVGRRNDIINVGGLKVHPEAVESVINQHPAVSMSRVFSRQSPITGAIVVADVVLGRAEGVSASVRTEIMDLCRDRLPRHQVPVSLRIVSSLPIAESGKLLRRYA